MKAKVWFNSRGRFYRSKGYSIRDAIILAGMTNAPYWARLAFLNGYDDQFTAWYK